MIMMLMLWWNDDRDHPNVQKFPPPSRAVVWHYGLIVMRTPAAVTDTTDRIHYH